MVDYDDLYKKNSAVFKSGPSPIVCQAVQQFANCAGLKALDLGAGQGRNAIFLAQQGFTVTAVDVSRVAVEQLRSLNHPKITPVLSDLNDYTIGEPYDLIISVNTLHYLPYDRIVSLTTEIGAALTRGGIMAITMLLGQKALQSVKLCDLVSDNFEILEYTEETKDDPGHPGQPFPHTHRIAGLIAKKTW